VPDEVILQRTHGVLTVCEYIGATRLDVIKIESIKAVVGMVPFCKQAGSRGPLYFLAEKLGLDVYESTRDDEDNNDD
jgi:hypothetical protein